MRRVFLEEFHQRGLQSTVLAERRFINERLAIFRLHARRGGEADMSDAARAAGHRSTAGRATGPRLKVVLYNPQAVFFTMPLALLAIGSELDPDIYEVVIIDGRLDADAESTVLAHLDASAVPRESRFSPARRFPMHCEYRAPPSGRGPTCPWSGGAGTRPCSRASVCASRRVDVTVRGQGKQTFAEIVRTPRRGSLPRGLRWVHRAARPTAPSTRIRRGHCAPVDNSARTTMD